MKSNFLYSLLLLSIELWPGRSAVAMEPGSCRYLFGTLGGDPARVVSQSSLGIRTVAMSVSWDIYEPHEGFYNESYRDELKTRLEAYRAAGANVLLTLGVQYAPAWIFNYVDSRFVNQYGDPYLAEGIGYNGVNAIFNNRLRDRQERFLARVLDDLGGANFFGIYLGWGWWGELNYPRSKYKGRDNCYWAFDGIAQGKSPGLPSGMAACPVPGWIPGTPSQDHQMASLFINWYLDSLKNYHDWQIKTLRKYFGGRALMAYPGWGIRPGDIETAVNADLNGSTAVENLERLQLGGDFKRFVSGITDPNLYVYTTWLDAQGDDNNSAPAQWTPVRYLSFLAQSNPVNSPLWGENAGPANYPAMLQSFSQMETYGLLGLNWSIGDDLYSGQYATISQYADLVAKYCSPPQPGAFSEDFNSNPSGSVNLVGSARWLASGGFGGSGCISLTDAAPAQQGTLHLPDLNKGRAINGFVAAFQLRIGGGRSRPADGFSFSFSNNLLPSDSAGEEGVPQGLTISFDTWDNGGDDTAPAIEVKVDGATVATRFMASIGGLERADGRAAGGPVFKDLISGAEFDMRTGTGFEPVRIEWRDGNLSLKFKGADIFQNLAIPLKAQAGHFLFGARTGGADDNHWIDDVSITTTLHTPEPQPNRVPILASIDDKSAVEGQRLTVFCSASDRDIPLQTLTFALGTDAPAGMTIDPVTGVLIWTPPPGLAGNVYSVRVRVTDNGSPNLSAETSFTLSVAKASGTALMLAPLPDIAVAEGSLARVEAKASAFRVVPGILKREIWTGLSGATLNLLTNASLNPLWPDNPDITGTVALFELPENAMDNYGARLSGFITAPESGNYTFYICSDDQSVLFLSTDENPANKQLIAFEPEWHSSRNWTGSEQRPNHENISKPIPLLAGHRYYVEAVIKEGLGGDNLGVNWKLPSQTTSPANGDPPIPPMYLSAEMPAPKSLISYSLINSPPGATIDPSTGVFTWTPHEASGPGRFDVAVRVTDNTVPALSDTKQFSIAVEEVNSPPILEPIGSLNLLEGTLLAVHCKASDPDIPAQQLVFSLDPGAPPGATIDPRTGILIWLAGNPAAGNVSFTVRVTDDGVPGLSDTKTFTAIVSALAAPEAFSAAVPRPGIVRIIWSTTPGQTYLLQTKTNLEDLAWTDLRTFNSTAKTSETIDSVDGFCQIFFRLARVP